MPGVELADLSIDVVWVDALGAKTTCCRIQTPDTAIAIDPGAAVMQTGYPLPDAPEEHR